MSSPHDRAEPINYPVTWTRLRVYPTLLHRETADRWIADGRLVAVPIIRVGPDGRQYSTFQVMDDDEAYELAEAVRASPPGYLTWPVAMEDGTYETVILRRHLWP